MNYRFKVNKNRIYRRLSFAALIILAGVIQLGDLLPRPFGLNFIPLLPLTIVIAMHERETYGLYFGILAGVIADFAVGSGDGFHTLLFALTGCLCGLMVTYIMMNNIRACMLLGLIFSLLYALSSHCVYAAFRGFEGSWGLLTGFYLPQALINYITLPIYYVTVRKIYDHFRRPEIDDFLL